MARDSPTGENASPHAELDVKTEQALADAVTRPSTNATSTSPVASSTASTPVTNTIDWLTSEEAPASIGGELVDHRIMDGQTSKTTDLAFRPAEIGRAHV